VKGEGLVESPMMVVQEIVSAPISVGTKGMKKGDSQSSEEKGAQLPPVLLC